MSNTSEYPELVIGLVAPVGVDLAAFNGKLNDLVKRYKYSPNHIRLSSLIENVEGLTTKIDKSSQYARINTLMSAGNEARKMADRNDFVAALGICTVFSWRKEEKPLNKQVHIFDSLKHPHEVQTLRDTYGDGFYLLAVACSRSNRLNYLEKQLGMTEEEAKALIERDEGEDYDFGQHMREAFHRADGFINTDDKDYINQISRILDLIFGDPCSTPTRDESAMFMAFAASLKSGDLSRQVGAVVTSSHNEIISIGANDVPSAGGGQYCTDDANDARDYNRGFDANEVARDEIVIKIMNNIGIEGNKEEILEKGKSILMDTGILDITEYGRAVHAEMEALISCARSGVSPRGGTIYCTTFPCHNCAKHIVAAGISKVVFIEPYPKSKALELHSDSIFLSDGEEKDGENGKVKFLPFVGVGPRRFIDLFSMSVSSGRDISRKVKGKKVDFIREKPSVRVPLSPMSYIDRETYVAAEIDRLVGGNTDDKEE